MFCNVLDSKCNKNKILRSASRNLLRQFGLGNNELISILHPIGQHASVSILQPIGQHASAPILWPIGYHASVLFFGPLDSMHQFVSYRPIGQQDGNLTNSNIMKATHKMTPCIKKDPSRYKKNLCYKIVYISM